MSLGVGGATGFSMASNHQTAHNHAFREAVSYDPAKQVRVKCTSCGCWANRGENCPQCKRPTAAVVQRRNNNVKVEPLSTVKKAKPAEGAASPAKTTSDATAPKTAPAPTKSTSPVRRPSVATSTSSAGASASATSHPDDAHNALKHKFRDEVAYDPAKQVKIKCSKCGCWAQKGVPCKLCKAVTSK